MGKISEGVSGNDKISLGGFSGPPETVDSVPHMLHMLRQLILYVETKPALLDGSSSFIRDHLRTLLIQTQPPTAQDSWPGGNCLRDPLWLAGAGGAGGDLLAATPATAAHLEIESMDAGEDLLVEGGAVTPGSGRVSAEAPLFTETMLSTGRVSVVRAPTPTNAFAAGAVGTNKSLTICRQTRSYVLGNRPATISDLPDDTLRRIFMYMSGPQLGRVRGVCKKWCKFASDENLWRKLCLENWRALETDQHLWRFLLEHHAPNAANEDGRELLIPEESRWRSMYPIVRYIPKWTCRLQKTGRFVCRLIAHQIGGPVMDEENIPPVVIVERRFNLNHLNEFVLPEAAVFYFEPEREDDRDGYQNFIEYLIQRHRAGLALDDERRIIFIPPCAYSRNVLRYTGDALLGVVQHSYPPLAT